MTNLAATESPPLIRLPFDAPPLETLFSVRQEAPPANEPAGGDRRFIVLCIEDSPSNLLLVELILRKRPEITLHTATRGGPGLQLAQQHVPDLILLDLVLPDIDGWDVLTELRQSAPTRHIPIIVVSADAMATQIERLMGAGVSAYLTKPINVAEFLRAVDGILQR